MIMQSAKLLKYLIYIKYSKDTNKTFNIFAN